MKSKIPTLARWGAVALMVGTLAACGGNGGSDVATAPPGAAPPPSGGVTVPAGAAAAITAAAALPANDTATAPTAAFGVVSSAGIAPVVVASPPKVSFTVMSGGAVVKGLTASNVSVIMAKLVPGTNGAPDQWVSYTNRTETATATVGPGGKPVLATANQATTDTKQTDPALLADQLKYNDAGFYTYTFSTDIKDPTKTNGVTYEPTLTHRVALQLSYTNAAGETVLVNPYFDFTLDASGNAVAVTDAAKSRKVVDITSCNECHSKLALHGGGRVDTQYCVLCHNAATTDANSGNVLDFRTMVHKIHAGEGVKELFGKDYTIWGYRDSANDYTEVTYPQPLTNCVKCHDGSKTPQGDNWKNVPSRAACGTCHAGIDFATGKGATIANAEADLEAGKPVGTTATGHIGGAKADDSQCVLCHGAVDIPVYHVTVDPTGANGRGGYPLNTAANVPTAGFPSGQGPSIPLASQLNLPAGVYKIGLEISKVTVAGAAGAKKATVVYRVLKDGAPVTFQSTGYLIANVDGTPDIYIAYAMTKDGIASPADWNTTASAHVIDIRDAKSGNSQTGPDASGYYTATLGATIPDAATMVTAGLGINYNGFVQLNVPAYPKGIRLREPAFVMKTADGYTARRPVVSNAKCNNCHGQLGVSPSFHSGARNNGEGCAFCHQPDTATGHTGAANNYGGGWSVQAKNLIHGIHGASKREQDYTYEATAANPKGFGIVTYPGILKQCETCHVAGSYDFSAAANAAAASNLLWTTDAKGDMTNAGGAPSIGLSPWVTTLGRGQVSYATDNLVSSPIAASCFGCHDSTAAIGHMQSQGGTLVSSASTVSTDTAGVGGVPSGTGNRAAAGFHFTKLEACLVCHGTGKPQDIKVMHAK
jgi:OmcA/MtrC family decaheme c-type cytochrome